MFACYFLSAAGLRCCAVSVCSLCTSQSFMWLPGTENLSVSCQRFQLCSVPLSALKNLLFHTHELQYLWPWFKWAVSVHGARVCLSFCVNVSVSCGRWEAIWHTSAQTDVAQHITVSPERDQKAPEHLDLWQPSPPANKLTLRRWLAPDRRGGWEGVEGTLTRCMSPVPTSLTTHLYLQRHFDWQVRNPTSLSEGCQSLLCGVRHSGLSQHGLVMACCTGAHSHHWGGSQAETDWDFGEGQTAGESDEERWEAGKGKTCWVSSSTIPTHALEKVQWRIILISTASFSFTFRERKKDHT